MKRSRYLIALGFLTLLVSSCYTPNADNVTLSQSTPDAMNDTRSSPDPRYGSWKFIHEIELSDLLKHPIWAWCMQLRLPDEDDGPIGGDETSMRPLLATNEVPMDHIAPPLILLRVKGTPHFASGLFHPKDGKLDSISIFHGEDTVPPSLVKDLPDPAVYVSVASIAGKSGVEFEATTKGADSAGRKP